ncbi:ORF1 [torque teno Delphinidae virus 6]
MPYFPYRRRARGRRGYGRFWSRRYWRPRYTRRRYRKYWTRRNPVRKLKRLYRLRRRRRAIFRKLRRRWRLRRLIGPRPIKYFIPPVRRRCTITGFIPLMYFNKAQMFFPFYDQYSRTFMGGGITMMDFSLNMLYQQYLLGHCVWSKSNFGFDFGRFTGAKFKLFRQNYFSYMVRYFQGHKITKEQTWMDIHPAGMLLQKERIIVASNTSIPYNKRHHTKKFKIHRGDDMTDEWYDMCELGSHTLVRLGAALCDFDSPFQTTLDGSNNYYISIGYDTPDRRTLSNYKGTLKETPPGTLIYDKADIQTWGQSWVTWGGPINTWLPPGQTTYWCSNKFAEVSGNTPSHPFAGITTMPEPCKSQMQVYPPAYLIRWYDPEYPDAEHFKDRKLMAYFCKGQTVPPWPAGHIKFPIDPQFSAFDNDYPPSTTVATQKQCSRSSHRSKEPNALGDFDNLDRNGPRTQGFWPGRYSWIYDNGAFNVVYGCWIPSSGSTTYGKFAAGQTGPGTGSTGNFKVVEFFHGVPYWKVFYGHNTTSFLQYLNNLRKDIAPQSQNNQGFIAVGIMCWPAYKVASGPFTPGYAPLRYAGRNREYHTSDTMLKKPWPKWWEAGTNMPPITDHGDIDYDATVFVLLRDGRKVMYGSSLEGSLLGIDRSFFCTAKVRDTLDDIANIGRMGPYVPENWPVGEKGKVINIPLKYKFYFQWGGYHYPGHWQKAQDPRLECKQPNGGTFDLSPSSRHRVKRHITTASSPGPVDPTEVSMQSFLPRRDLSPGGSILPVSLTPAYHRPFINSARRPRPPEVWEANRNAAIQRLRRSQQKKRPANHGIRNGFVEQRREENTAQKTETNALVGVCLPRRTNGVPWTVDQCLPWGPGMHTVHASLASSLHEKRIKQRQRLERLQHQQLQLLQLEQRRQSLTSLSRSQSCTSL